MNASREGNHFVLFEKKIHIRFNKIEIRVIGIKKSKSGENCLKIPFSFKIIFLCNSFVLRVELWLIG